MTNPDIYILREAAIQQLQEAIALGRMRIPDIYTALENVLTAAEMESLYLYMADNRADYQ